ncbi:MAG TPA: hypothetical protein ENG81_04400 [Candidatus Bathyarchaeota archaeon]|nr:hypothetical protein [Candidatus Bathyarchaeota archaeon]
MESGVEKIFNMAYDRYISPSSYERMLSNGWDFIQFPFGGGNANKIMEDIDKYLRNGMIVRCGYMATSIRGYHDHYIITKRKR